MKKILFLLLIIFCSASIYAEETKPKEDEPAFSGRSITLQDFGAADLGFISLPEQPPSYGVLLIPDSYGLSNGMKSQCDWVALHGNIALAIDLFNGHVAKDEQEALRMQQQLREESSLKTIQAGLHLLTGSPRLQADRVMVAAFGKQCNLTLKSKDILKIQKVTVLTWFEPEGNIDYELLNECPLPILIIVSSQSPISDMFLESLEENLKPKKKASVTIKKYEGTPGFSLTAEPNADQTLAWSAVMDFWNEASEGKYDRPKDLFDKWFGD